MTTAAFIPTELFARHSMVDEKTGKRIKMWLDNTIGWTWLSVNDQLDSI